MVTRLSGGITPADGSDPRTFPTIWNATATTIESQGSAITTAESDIDALEAKNPQTFGTATPTDGQILSYSTAISGYEPVDSFGEEANGTAIYRLADTIYYTSSGSFVKGNYPWLRALRIKVQAAGGGAGGCGSTSSGEFAFGAGGGGGAYGESFVTDIAGLSSTETITVGAGGSGGVGNTAGSNGGSSSFGTVVTASGGDGGIAGGASGVTYTRVCAPGGVIGTGDLTIAGGAVGQNTGRFLTQVSPCNGGASVLGSGGPSTLSAGTDGSPGGQYGGGGSGGANGESQAARDGGTGASGVVILELFA